MFCYENWRQSPETTHKKGKDRKIISDAGWKPNDDKCPVTKVVDGHGVMVMYSKDGTEFGRFTYKGGAMVRDRPPPTAPPCSLDRRPRRVRVRG